MKKFIVSCLLLSTTLFANESLNSIFENILLKNSKQAILDIQQVKKDIEKDNKNEIKISFKNLVKSWKSVDAFYILGDLDDNYLDTPRYIDTFHQGNEDIKKQLDLIIEEKDDLSISLYKNSHKTINALEYILFTKNLKNTRVKNIALIISSKLEENLNEIYNGYVEAKETFLKDEITANAMMLNSLIENSYKIKEWRVGDPSGQSRKFKGKASNDRAEYSISKNSMVAINSILNTHLMILGNQKFKNFGSMIKSYEVSDELNDAVMYLKASLKHAKLVKNDDFKDAKKLYKSLKKLHSTYYISLIGKLKVTAKILDADGD
jgi:hypothetical protein